MGSTDELSVKCTSQSDVKIFGEETQVSENIHINKEEIDFLCKKVELILENIKDIKATLNRCSIIPK